jgi:hypothetical protein
MTYDVVLLVEKALTPGDARQVLALHDGIDDEEVVYHVLLPLEDAAARIESAMGSLAAGEVISSPAMVMSDVDIDAVRRDCKDRSDHDLAVTVAALEAVGATVRGKVVTEPPVDALASCVEAVDGREAIILTRPHVVAEFFHVDWTSRARRKIGVPCLHLLEHETFDEQAGGGEGITGV